MTYQIFKTILNNLSIETEIDPFSHYVSFMGFFSEEVGRYSNINQAISQNTLASDFNSRRLHSLD